MTWMSLDGRPSVTVAAPSLEEISLHLNAAVAAQRGSHTASVQFGPLRIHVHAEIAGDLDLFLDPMAHLMVEPGVAPSPESLPTRTMTVDLVTYEFLASTALMEQLLSLSPLANTEGVVWLDPWTRTLRILDRSRDAAYLVYRKVEEPLWRRPEFSRSFMGLLAHEIGGTALHGATIGDSHRGILIVGRGGSGKSTLVARSLAHGLRTTGDDYLLHHGAHEGSVGRISSVYRTIKVPLKTDVGEWDQADTGLFSEEGDKRILHPDRMAPQCMVRTHSPVAIVVPSFGPQFTVSPAAPEVVLRALLPTSVTMSVEPTGVVRASRCLVGSLPSFQMTLGQDFSRDLPGLMGFMASLGVLPAEDLS